MDNNLETMWKTQLQEGLTRALDSAVQVGDINAARKAMQQIADMAVKNAKDTPIQFTDTDIREALKVKAPWFGVDPRRSAKAVEFGKNMDPRSFKSAEIFADELIKAVDREFKKVEELEDEDEDEDEYEEKEKKVTRKKTDAPSGETARAIPRRSSNGPWMRLSDAPKEIADTIKNAVDKFTRNATKEQRDKYISTALGTAYAADQRTKGKK